MAAAPTENGIPLDQFNDALRASPGWQAFMKRNGFALDGSPIRLSDDQRKALKRELEQTGVQFESGMEIDPAGNLNQDQGVSRAWRNPIVKIAVIGGAALATMGVAGYGPLAGLLSGGGNAGIGASSLAAGNAGINSAVNAGMASMAGGGGAAAGMSSWLTPLLTYGVPAATALIGGKMALGAEKDALAANQSYLDRALAAELEDRDYNRKFAEGERDEERRRYADTTGYNREQFGGYLSRLAPYANAGQPSLGRLEGLLGGGAGGARSAAPAQASGPLVPMRGPDGSVREVPQAEVQHWTSKGARPV